MKIHQLLTFAIWSCTVFALVSCATDKGDRRTVSVADQLRGSWSCISLLEAGKKASDAERQETKLCFEGETVSATACSSTATGTYLVVTNSYPLAMDITYIAEGKEIRVPAIVEIRGATMTLCHPAGEGGSRPRKFEATTETVLAVLRKDAE